MGATHERSSEGTPEEAVPAQGSRSQGRRTLETEDSCLRQTRRRQDWVSLDFRNVYYIDSEGGADLKHYTDKLKASGGRYFGPDQGSLDFNEVINQLQALATESQPFKTVVVDGFTKLFNLEVAHEAERLGDKNAFGADKKPAIASTRRPVSWLMRLDMNVVLICHEKPLWGTDSKGERSKSGVTFDGWDKLE